jgi:hypothetical protein
MRTLILLLFLVGCGESPDTRQHTNPWLGDGSVAAFQLDEDFEVDLTGDGTPELVGITVGGETIRSLEIELTITSAGGDLLHGDTWSAGDYPQIARDEDLPGWVASEVVRDHLNELLAEESLEPLVEDEIEGADALVGRPALRYLAGDRYTVLVWDPEAGAFVIAVY